MAGNVQHLVQEREGQKLAVVSTERRRGVATAPKQFTAVARKPRRARSSLRSATAPGAPDCASRMLAARASGAEAWW